MTLKLQCPVCREEAPVATFVAEANAVLVECTSCGAEVRVDSGGKLEVVEGSVERTRGGESTAAAQDEDARQCAKCGTVVLEADAACRSCGLLVERMSDYEPEQVGDEDLLEIWADVEADWTDDDVHERYLGRVVELDAYATAARQYRARAQSGDSRAQAYLERVGRMAQAVLTRKAAADEDREEPFRGVALLLIFLLLAAGIVGVYAVTKVRGAGGEPAVPTGLGSRR